MQETQYFRPITPDEFDHLHEIYPPVRDGCLRRLRLAMGDSRNGRQLLADFAADRWGQGFAIQFCKCGNGFGERRVPSSYMI